MNAPEHLTNQYAGTTYPTRNAAAVAVAWDYVVAHTMFPLTIENATDRKRVLSELRELALWGIADDVGNEKRAEVIYYALQNLTAEVLASGK